MYDRSDTTPQPPDDLQLLTAVHERCCEFEAVWLQGERPRLADYLEGFTGPARASLLRSLVQSDWELRTDAGEQPRPLDYLQLFPADELVVWAAVNELLEEEKCEERAEYPAHRDVPTTAAGAPRNVPTPALEVDAQHMPQGFPSTVSEGRPLQIGPLEILEEISRGGMGVVYRARDLRLGREVAVKVILAGHLASPTDVQRFELESRTVARLDHPGIVPIYEFGSWAGHHYLVMPLVAGTNLAEVLRAGSLPTSQAVELMRQIAWAIDHAHRAGVLHRDLKPRNILIDEAGRARITDFGLAKLIRDPTSEGEASTREAESWVPAVAMTLTGQILGTPNYMAPEQAAGIQANIGPAADVFSLGVILYELLTGEVPFRGATVLETLQLIQSSDPGSLHQLRHRGPRDLVTICLKCLEKAPYQRYPSAAEFAQDLENFQANRPIRARRTSVWGRCLRWSRRHKLVATLLTLVVTLTMAMAIGAPVAAWRFRQEELEARAAEAAAIRAENERRLELVRVYVAECRSALADGNPHARRRGLSALQNAQQLVPWQELPADIQFDMLDAAIPCVTRPEILELGKVSTHLDRGVWDTPEIQVDSAATLFAQRTADSSGLELVPLGGDRPVATYHLPEKIDRAVTIPSISRRGRWVAAWLRGYRNRRMYIWERETNRLALDLSIDVASVEFLPDERHVLVVCEYLYLRLYDLETGQLVAESPHHFRTDRVTISPNGEWLAISGQGVPLQIVDRRTWETLASLPDSVSAIATVWHPRDPVLYFGTTSGEIRRAEYHADRWHVTQIDHHHETRIERLLISPQGNWLASHDATRRTYLRSLQGFFAEIPLDGTPLQFGPTEGQIILHRGLQVVTAQIDLAGAHRVWSGPAQAAEFSPNGPWIAVSSQQGVKLLDKNRFEVVADLGLDPAGPVAFAPDGKSFIAFGKFSQAQLWPIQPIDSGWKVGPPQLIRLTANLFNPWQFQLSPQHRGRHAAWTADGEKFVISDTRRDQLYLVNASGLTSHLAAETLAAEHVKISGDGRWMVAQGLHFHAVEVWNTERHVRELIVDGARWADFHPRLPELAVATDLAIRIHEVPSWREVRRYPIPEIRHRQGCILAYHPSGKLLAAATGDQRIQLMASDTGQVLMRLPTRPDQITTWLDFSDDGNSLLVSQKSGVDLWRLDELQIELESCGIPGPLRHVIANQANSMANSPGTTSPVEVDRGVLPPANSWHLLEVQLARGEASQQRWADALDDMHKALELVAPTDTQVQADLLRECGMYYYASANFDGALDSWQTALARDPTSAATQSLLARLYLLGPHRLQAPQLALGLANGLEQSEAWAEEGRMLSRWARIRLRIPAPDLSIGQTSASLNSTNSPAEPVEPSSEPWRLPDRYFDLLYRIQTTPQSVAQRTTWQREFDEFTAADRQRSQALPIALQRELDRLTADVHEALAKLDSSS